MVNNDDRPRYDQAGPLQPGLVLVVNTTGRAERIWTDRDQRNGDWQRRGPWR